MTYTQIMKNVVTSNVGHINEQQQKKEIMDFLENLNDNDTITIPKGISKKISDSKVIKSPAGKAMLGLDTINKRIATDYLKYLYKNNKVDDAIQFYNEIKPKNILKAIGHPGTREVEDIGEGKKLWDYYELNYLSPLEEKLGNKTRILSQYYNEQFYSDLSKTMSTLTSNNVLSDKARKLLILTAAELNYVHSDLSVKYLESVRNFSKVVKDSPDLFEEGMEEFLVQTSLITNPLFRSESHTASRTFMNRLYAYRHIDNAIKKFGHLGRDDISSTGRTALWDNFIKSKPAQDPPHLYYREVPLQKRTELIDPDFNKHQTRFILSPLQELEYNVNVLGYMTGGRVNSGAMNKYDGSANIGGIKLPDDFFHNFRKIGTFFDYGFYPRMTTELNIRIPYESWELSKYKVKDVVKNCFVMDERIHNWDVNRGYGGAAGGGYKNEEDNTIKPMIGGIFSISGEEINYEKIIEPDSLKEKYSEVEYRGKKYKLRVKEDKIQLGKDNLPLYDRIDEEEAKKTSEGKIISLKELVNEGIIEVDFSDLKVPFGLETGGEQLPDGYFAGGSVWAADLGSVADITNMLYAQEREDTEMKLLGNALMNVGSESFSNNTLFFVKGFETEEEGKTMGGGLGKAYIVQDDRLYEIRAGRNDFIDILNYCSLKVNEDMANITAEASYQDKTETGGTVFAIDLNKFSGLAHVQKVPQRITYTKEDEEVDYYQFTLGGSLQDFNIFLGDTGKSDTTLAIPLDYIQIKDINKDYSKVKPNEKEGFKTGAIYIEKNEESRLTMSFEGGQIKSKKLKENETETEIETEEEKKIVIDTGFIFDHDYTKENVRNRYSLGARFNTGNSNFDDVANAEQEMTEYLDEFYRVSFLLSGIKNKEEFNSVWAATIIPVIQFKESVDEEGNKKTDVAPLGRIIAAYRDLKKRGIKIDFSRATNFDNFVSEYQEFKNKYSMGEPMNKSDLDKDLEEYNDKFKELSSVLYNGNIVSTFDERGSGLALNFQWYEEDKLPENAGFYFVQNFRDGFVRGYTNIKPNLDSDKKSELGDDDKLLTLFAGAGGGFDIKETSRMVVDAGITASLIRQNVSEDGSSRIGSSRIDEVFPPIAKQPQISRIATDERKEKYSAEVDTFFGRILVRFNENINRRQKLNEDFSFFTKLYNNYQKGEVKDTSSLRKNDFIDELISLTNVEGVKDLLEMKPEELGPHIEKALKNKNKEISKSMSEPITSLGILYSRDLQDDINVAEVQLMVEKLETLSLYFISRTTFPDFGSKQKGFAQEIATGYSHFFGDYKKWKLGFETGVRGSTLEEIGEVPFGSFLRLMVGTENVEVFGQFNNEWTKFNDIHEKLNEDEKKAWGFFIGLTFRY
jgi:hypothetical protein